MKNARATDPITSIIAGEQAAKFAGGHYAKIFDSLAGGATLTAGEIAAACDMSVEQVCRRLPEMQRAAMVAVLQHEGNDLVRNSYRVWQAIKNPPGVSRGGKGEEGNNGANVSDKKTDCKGGVALNYYQFHIGDFRSGTVNMSRHARWIYRDMLDVYYDKEGPLPLDLDELCDAIGVESDEERGIVERHLRFKFEKRGDGYHNETCNRVISEYHGKADTARTNGKLGGRPKKPKKTQSVMSGLQSGSDMVGKTKPKQTQSQANQEPLTKNQEPLTIINSVADATDAKPSKITDPAEIIFGYGVGMLASAGVTDKQARSFLGGLRKAHGDKLLVDKLRDCARERPLQPLEWLAAALPPPSVGAKGKEKNENFDAKDYGSGVGKI